MFKSLKKFIVLLAVAVFIAVVTIFLPKIELKSPEISFSRDISNIGLAPFDIYFSDEGQGLKNIMVYLVVNDREHLLAEKNLKIGTSKEVITIRLNPKKLPIKDGPAYLIVKAEDYSKVKIVSGNRAKFKKKVMLDLTAPKLTEVSSPQYLTHGGSGFIIYRATKDTVKSGVRLKDYFFKGYRGLFEDDNLFVCYFAYPYDLVDKEILTIIAEDRAGNETVLAVSYGLNKTAYRARDINISETFVINKMLPLVQGEEYSRENLKEIFLRVNNELRNENNKKISDIASRSTNIQLWKDKFSQLSKSKVEANFADKRNYVLNGEVIDQQYHFGYDLSVTKKYPVEAANNGIVVYADDLGIYGNTVILDHGLGVMSLYSHLSSISVKVGDNIKRNGIIGNTGVTGLAGGDHLHFGIYIHGVPVRPLEWWDAKWIKRNISSRSKGLQLKKDS
ncbi:MAG: peptidoglycan DD-metalloendopeptidase family protein [Candidatus Dadabacteria bacterium]|nr:peptidoglycan DD-metalloendopeptidase family protein [Candidatus Dadabacteria bacterium]NIQ13791.1 peptidoglycan DD-metalloendopeptidase family protein [Candidatus Dadabacteria bacterium]